MNDFQAVLAPKSDQINAQDLIAGDMTITIRSVKVTPGTEQPVSISFEGSDKVWRPCKTTGRILMAAWGADTSVYAGRSVQLYLDPEVKWGGMKVGGIRIRAMSHIDSELRLALAESKQNRKIFAVKPLVAGVARRADPSPIDAATDAALRDANPTVAKAKAAARKGTAAFREWFNSDEGKDCRATGYLTPHVLAECKAIASGADNLAERMANDPFAPAGEPDPRTATDREIEAQVERETREFAERMVDERGVGK
jgi:hypothetical protein